MSVSRSLINLLFPIILSTFAFSQESMWKPKPLKDPFTGKEVQAYDIEKVTDNIYLWPSKYDGVFWPYTDPHFLVFNSDHGYINLLPSFERLSDSQKLKLQEKIDAHYKKSDKELSHYEKVLWYGQLHLNEKATLQNLIQHQCLLAYLSRSNPDKNKQHRLEALIHLKKKFKIANKGNEVAQLHTVAGFYEFLNGNKSQAEKHFEQALKTPVPKMNVDQHKRFLDYLTQIQISIIEGTYKEEYLKGNPKL